MRWLLLISSLLSSCALTAPEGTKELKSAIESDRRLLSQDGENPLQGRPVYLKVRAYPRFGNGNIYGPSWILLNVGREKLTMKNYLEHMGD